MFVLSTFKAYICHDTFSHLNKGLISYLIFYSQFSILSPKEPAPKSHQLAPLKLNLICTPVFTAALFTIAKTWKQPTCPSTDEWIKEMWYIYIQWNITQP